MINRRTILASAIGALVPKPKKKEVKQPMVWSNTSTTSLTFPPGAITGERIVIDGNGIIMYNAANQVVFALVETSSTIPTNQLANGSMVFSNDFGTPQFTFFGGKNVPGAPDNIISANNGLIKINSQFAVTQSRFSYDTWTQQWLDPIAVPFVPKGFAFGDNGTFGRYYYEEKTVTTQACANATPTNLNFGAGASTKLNSDVGSCWAGATWTCPEDGIYEFDFAFTGLTVGSYIGYCRLIKNGAVAIYNNGSAATATQWMGVSNGVSRRWLTKGDTIVMQIDQANGVSQNVSGTMTVYRQF